MLAIVNGPDGIDCQLEAELADLPDAEAVEFREGRRSALEEIVQRLKDALDLIAFFTVGEKETRAWTLRRGQTALEAGATIHSDIARGFIRCEVIRWNDLLESGSHAEAAKRATARTLPDCPTASGNCAQGASTRGSFFSKPKPTR